jgi:regulator of replication initiation timing
MKTIAVGARVAMKNAVGQLSVGKKGTVTENRQFQSTHLTNAVLVKWDEPYRASWDGSMVVEQYIHVDHLNEIEIEPEFQIGDLVECIENDWNTNRGIKQGTAGVIVGATDHGILKVKFDQDEPAEEYILTFPKRLKRICRPRFKVGDVVAHKHAPGLRFGVISRTRPTPSRVANEAVHWVRVNDVETLRDERELLPFVEPEKEAPDITVVKLREENDVRINEMEYDGSLKKSVEWVDAVRNAPSKDHRIHYVKAIRAAYSKGVKDAAAERAALQEMNVHQRKLIMGFEDEVKKSAQLVTVMRDALAEQIKELQGENTLLKDENKNLRMRLNDHQSYSSRIAQQGHAINNEFDKAQVEKVARLEKRLHEISDQLVAERGAWHQQARVDKATIRALKRRMNRLHHTLQRVKWIATNMCDGPPSRAERELMRDAV